MLDWCAANCGTGRHSGSTLIEEREIRVDESLDPVENPEAVYSASDGEIGYWELHRRQIMAISAEPLLLAGASIARGVPVSADLQVGSSKQSYGSARREAQNQWSSRQNEFAACLLMPRGLVQAVWQQKFGNLIRFSWRIARVSSLSCGLPPRPVAREVSAIEWRGAPRGVGAQTLPESFAPPDARCGSACASWPHSSLNNRRHDLATPPCLADCVC
jgi:hypothetical protein